MKMHYVSMLLFLFVISSCTTETTEQANIIEAENVLDVEQQVLALVNEHRDSLGFNTLTFSDIAYTYANKHTDYMIAKGTINHDHFEARASKISSEAHAVAVSENVAKEYNSAREAYQKWIASPEHRETIEGAFTHTAVSVKRNTKGALYFTQLFYR